MSRGLGDVYKRQEEEYRQLQQNGAGKDWIFPIYMTPNTQVLDTIVLRAKDRANAISGGNEF